MFINVTKSESATCPYIWMCNVDLFFKLIICIGDALGGKTIFFSTWLMWIIKKTKQKYSLAVIEKLNSYVYWFDWVPNREKIHLKYINK